jgi:putative endonuclease
MPLFSWLIFQAVRWRARRGLREEAPKEEASDRAPETAGHPVEARKKIAQRTGLRGETYAYWHLRRLGYVFIARNYHPRLAKGEIDMIGYDGDTLAFVEVRTRTLRDELTALPELSVTPGKQHMLVRTAKFFLAERRLKDSALRFDVLAIDNEPGAPPVVRLHKDAFSPQV